MRLAVIPPSITTFRAGIHKTPRAVRGPLRALLFSLPRRLSASAIRGDSRRRASPPTGDGHSRDDARILVGGLHSLRHKDHEVPARFTDSATRPRNAVSL